MVASRWSEFLDGSSELPEQKFQEPVSGSHCDLKTGSGNRCGTTSTMCYWSCNHRTSVDRERECRWHLWMEKVSKTLWPSLIYDKYHFFSFWQQGAVERFLSWHLGDLGAGLSFPVSPSCELEGIPLQSQALQLPQWWVGSVVLKVWSLAKQHQLHLKNVLEKQILKPHPRTTESEILVKAQQVCVTKLFRGFWYTQSLESAWVSWSPKSLSAFCNSNYRRSPLIP